MNQPNVILALGPDLTEKTRWPCHKDILQSSSVYFQTIFSNQFQEADASIIFLPRGIFSSAVLDDVVYYLYHKSIQSDFESTLKQLEHLEAIYCAADYLSIEDLCDLMAKQISELAHGITCSCHSCICIIPQLVLFSGPRYDDPRLSKITDLIIKLYTNDPEKALATYWVSLSSNVLFSDLTVHQYLEDEILKHISKNNAIETLHGCFLADQVKDHQGRSPQVNNTIVKIRETSAQLVADHFDFYCTQYPKLLSCVDGITYSFDFLEYLLQYVVRDKIKVTNACSLYKGVVRSLMSRAVQTRTQQLLQTTKNKIINYIATHLDEIKAAKSIDKTIIESLALELLVPLNTLNDTPRKTSGNRPVPEIKKRTQETSWNIKMKSRFYTIVFGQATLNFKVGQRVQLLNRPVLTYGTIRYVGKISENPFCLGVELDRSVGTNDGTLKGKQYFKTSTNRGVFVQPNEVTLA